MKVLSVRRTDRFAGAAFAIVVQAALLVLLLSSRPLLTPPAALVRELTLILPRLPKVEPAPAPATAQRPSIVPITPQVLAPPISGIAPSPTARPDLRNLGQSIFGCAPENYASLTPSQRALCARSSDGVAVRQAPNLMGLPSQSKDQGHWKREWVRKEGPLLLPGASPDRLGITVLAIGGSKASLLDPDPDTAGLYDIPKPAPEDFYKGEQATAAWNKAHGGR